jgi:SnoaL-like domain
MRWYGHCLISLATLLCFVSPTLAAPLRGWAHSSGLINLEPNGRASSNDNALERLKIQEVLARWGIAYDEGRIEVIKSLFTDDAVFQVTLGSATPIAAASGRDAIVKTVMAAMSQQGDQRRHVISNVVIQKLTATRASLIAYAVVLVAGDTPSVGATVVYSADLQKNATGIWQFTKLLIGMDVYAGTVPAAAKDSAGAKQ